MADKNHPAPSLLRHRDLEARLKLGRSTIYNRINPKSPRFDATFPKLIRLGNGTAVGRIEGEFEDWVRAQIEASRKTD